MAKEAMVIVGHELGASYAGLAKLIGVDSSVVSRRFESGKAKMSESQEARRLVKRLQTEMARTK